MSGHCVHVVACSNGHGYWGVGCVGEEGKLEDNILVELHTDSIGLLHQGRVVEEHILVMGRKAGTQWGRVEKGRGKLNGYSSVVLESCTMSPSV